MRTLLSALTAGLALLVPGVAWATFPGESGRLAFVTGGVIHTIRPNGTGDQRLVGPAGSPSWSADGQHIVYERFLGSPNAEIYTMRADGSNQRRLTHSRLHEGGPFFSPNGVRIVFNRVAPGSDSDLIITMRSDGSDQRVLAGGQKWAYEYTPSGKRIVYTAPSRMTETGAIWDMRPDGSDRRQLTFPNKHQGDTSPHYSPDGKRIIFWRHGKRNHPYVMDSDGSGLHRVGCGEVFSPDGRRLAWTGQAGGDPLTADIFTSALSCADPFRVTHYADTPSGGAGGPSWQPLP